MSELRVPVRESLRRPIDDVAAQRIWSGVRSARERRTLPHRRVRLAMIAAAALAAILAFVIIARPSRPGPLALDADRLVVEVDAGDAPRTVRASDGSTIILAPSARLEVLDNSGDAFTTHLSRGRAAFDVVPNGGRRWTVECGSFAVEVIGTAFTIERDDRGARVSVSRGEVQVRGERVPNRVARLVAGQDEIGAGGATPSLTSSAAQSSPAPAPSAAIEIAPSVTPSASASPPRGPSSASAPPSASAAAGDAPWREFARAGDFERAYDALGAGGMQRAAAGASVDELFALADVARLSGHPLEAEQPLQRIVSEHGGDRRASLAALTLGRLYLDALGRPAAAIAPLNRAIAAGLPGGLAEDALARRVEAYARSGNLEAARASVVELERRFPASGRLGAARRWTEPRE